MSQSVQGPPPGEVTQLLAAVRQGDGRAMDRLMTLVYDELRAVAHRQLRRWRPGQTLDTTALVHEAYLRLVDQAGASGRKLGGGAEPATKSWAERWSFRRT